MDAYLGNLVFPDGVRRGTVFLDKGKIKKISGMKGKDYSFCYIMPGFLDIHFHGTHGMTCEENISEISRRLTPQGVVGFCATLVPQPLQSLFETSKRISESKSFHSRLLGIHLEGPALNALERGALNAHHFFNPTREQWRKLLSTNVRIVTVAPEICGTATIKFLSKQCVVSLGHSCATFLQAQKAFGAGAQSTTHIFNAMSFHHRDPGIVGAAFESHAFFEIVLDNVHVHPSLAKPTMKGRQERAILVTDSVASGLRDGMYEWGGKKILVKKGICLTEEGTLAGSSLTMAEAFKNCVRLGFSLPEASRMASLNASQLLGLKKGILGCGYDADLVFLDEKLNVVKTIVSGNVVFER